MLISTIGLSDDVERVGNTGVAIELSDQGARTGIVYMVQLRNETSALGLFGSLPVGSDRTVAVARRQGYYCFARGWRWTESLCFAPSLHLLFLLLLFCRTSGLMDASSHLTYQTYQTLALRTFILISWLALLISGSSSLLLSASPVRIFLIRSLHISWFYD